MMLFEHDPAALALFVVTCLSILFAIGFLSNLVLSVASESKQSARELNDMFRFMRESKPLLDEYYHRQRRGQFEDKVAVTAAVDGIVGARD